MNILMLGRWLPPARRPVRSTREYQFARYLARQHQLTLAFVGDNPDAVGAISALRSEFGDLEFAFIPRGWKTLASAVHLATGESCTLSYYRSEALRTRLADRVRRTHYDVVFVSSSSMIQYALGLEDTSPLVVDFGRVDSEWWVHEAARTSFPGSRFFRTEAARLRLAEAAAARRASLCTAETAEAARIVESLAPGAEVRVIPSGVEVNEKPRTRPAGRVPTVVVNASLGSAEELRDVQEFCSGVVAAVRARVPQVRFVVVSRDAVNGSRVGGALEKVELVTGGDSRLLYHDQTVVVTPLHGRFDVLASVIEAMASGVPVVTSSKVRDQLLARGGRDLVVADAPSDCGREVVELLESQSRRDAIAANGRLFVWGHFRWELFGERLEQLLSGVAKGQFRSGGASEPPMRAALGG